MVMKMLTKMIKTKEIYLMIMPFIGLNTLQIEHDDICWVEYITNKLNIESRSTLVSKIKSNSLTFCQKVSSLFNLSC